MSDSKAPESLVELAPELLDLVLTYLGPQELTRFGATCRRARDFTRPTNQLLWKQTFLHKFDHPKHVWNQLVPTARSANQPREALWDWHRELMRRMKVFHLLLGGNSQTIAPQIENVVNTLLDVQQTASRTHKLGYNELQSLNIKYLKYIERRIESLDFIVHDFTRHPNSLAVPNQLKMDLDLHRPVTRSILRNSAAVPEYASRFHVSYQFRKACHSSNKSKIIYGPTQREQESTAAKAGARAIVYDWGVTSEEADFGPFNKDGTGTVNWQAVEAISSLMHRIFDTALKAYQLSPTGFDIHVPQTQPKDPANPKDWAGVTSIWVGTYAFLDYRALVHYNFSHSLEHPLDLGNYEEACGDLMRLNLKLDDSEELKEDERLQTNLPYCNDLPKLFFEGTSTRQATERPSITVRGVACLAPGGREVRWRLIIR